MWRSLLFRLCRHHQPWLWSHPGIERVSQLVLPILYDWNQTQLRVIRCRRKSGQDVVFIVVSLHRLANRRIFFSIFVSNTRQQCLPIEVCIVRPKASPSAWPIDDIHTYTERKKNKITACLACLLEFLGFEIRLVPNVCFTFYIFAYNLSFIFKTLDLKLWSLFSLNTHTHTHTVLEQRVYVFYMSLNITVDRTLNFYVNFPNIFLENIFGKIDSFY